MRPVPVVDIAEARLGDPTARADAAKLLDEACRNSGFFAITGHGVDRDIVDAVVRTSKEFFALPHSEKSKVAPPSEEVFRGYLGMDTTSLAATLGEESPPDLSESFNVSRFDTPESRTAAGMPEGREAFFFPNLWPERPAGLRPAYETYYAALEMLAAEVMSLLALALDLPGDWFAPYIDQHTALMLVNHYPVVGDEPLPGQLRRGAHTDYGAITLLWAGPEPGLEIHLDGEWRAVSPPEDAFVVNLGDLMARWTNDVWRSTLHRVVVPGSTGDRGERMSIPFFLQPNYNAEITTIPTTITTDNPARYEPVVAGEWILAKSMAMLEEGDEA